MHCFNLLSHTNISSYFDRLSRCSPAVVLSTFVLDFFDEVSCELLSYGRSCCLTYTIARASVAFVELDLAQIGFDSATLFCHHLAQNFGIVLLPGRCLGFEDNFVRFGLGRSKFGDALQAFANIIKTF